MSNKIPTAEEMALQRNGGDYTHFEEIVELMKEFAQLHVEAALKAASEKAKIIDDPTSYTGNTGSEYLPDQIVSRKSILNAYPKENIL